MQLIEAAIATGLSKRVAESRIERLQPADAKALEEACKDSLPVDFRQQFTLAVSRAAKRKRGDKIKGKKPESPVHQSNESP